MNATAARTTRTATSRTSNARAKKLNPGSDFSREIEKIRSELFGYALRLTRCPSAADDLIQDTVLRVISNRHHFQRGTNLMAWANQILFSIFITRCRRERLERSTAERILREPGTWTLPEKRPETLTLMPGMARALASLPLPFRAVIVLVDLEEMPYRDAAILLGVPLGTVMSRLSRGRSMLADLVLRVREPSIAA